MKMFTKLSFLLCSLVFLSVFASANVEVHIDRGITDDDSYYETVGGVEDANGAKGEENWFTQGPLTLSQVAYGWHDNSTDFTSSMASYSPSYSWYILDNPTNLSLGDDEISNFISLGFNTKFYGLFYNQIRVSSNGFVTFADSTDHGCCQGQDLPNSASPNNLVAGWWEDLRPASGGGAGTIKFQTFGSAPTRKMVVEFNDVAHYGYDGKRVTFQIVILEQA